MLSSNASAVLARVEKFKFLLSESPEEANEYWLQDVYLRLYFSGYALCDEDNSTWMTITDDQLRDHMKQVLDAGCLELAKSIFLGSERFFYLRKDIEEGFYSESLLKLISQYDAISKEKLEQAFEFVILFCKAWRCGRALDKLQKKISIESFNRTKFKRTVARFLKHRISCIEFHNIYEKFEESLFNADLVELERLLEKPSLKTWLIRSNYLADLEAGEKVRVTGYVSFAAQLAIFKQALKIGSLSIVSHLWQNSILLPAFFMAYPLYFRNGQNSLVTEQELQNAHVSIQSLLKVHGSNQCLINIAATIDLGLQVLSEEKNNLEEGLWRHFEPTFIGNLSESNNEIGPQNDFLLTAFNSNLLEFLALRGDQFLDGTHFSSIPDEDLMRNFHVAINLGNESLIKAMCIGNDRLFALLCSRFPKDTHEIAAYFSQNPSRPYPKLNLDKQAQFQQAAEHKNLASMLSLLEEDQALLDWLSGYLVQVGESAVTFISFAWLHFCFNQIFSSGKEDLIQQLLMHPLLQAFYSGLPVNFARYDNPDLRQITEAYQAQHFDLMGRTNLPPHLKQVLHGVGHYCLFPSSTSADILPSPLNTLGFGWEL